mmetsp:Transcript_5489/g.20032  ORF Transcript_5489/g.20032 Transcript_5489/m.20032 type:complete len:219 (-) Transcript_5489:236-892(-)
MCKFGCTQSIAPAALSSSVRTTPLRTSPTGSALRRSWAPSRTSMATGSATHGTTTTIGARAARWDRGAVGRAILCRGCWMTPPSPTKLFGTTRTMMLEEPWTATSHGSWIVLSRAHPVSRRHPAARNSYIRWFSTLGMRVGRSASAAMARYSRGSRGSASSTASTRARSNTMMARVPRCYGATSTASSPRRFPASCPGFPLSFPSAPKTGTPSVPLQA